MTWRYPFLALSLLLLYDAQYKSKKKHVSMCIGEFYYKKGKSMPRAIDFHVHLPTTEFMQVTLGPYAQAAERFFRTEVKLKDIEQIAQDYADLDMIGVLLAWDAETATGLPPLGNDYVA